ncbi:tetratricopeptide repeat protein [Metallosphaera cuprina]|uniref:TPR repeat-containing protein n=1 Tax=Metallosphaera cuprina (strain Ar-4) TaxID=1006006 RepID=F4G1J8_METCR|nr:hypothetical protein [Metallosphaera cuprina]AEB94811.1 TPR repeat-containing protein [Metallosphaera cuprina Ar-4]
MDPLSLMSTGNLNLALIKIRELIAQNPSKENYQLLGRILLELGRDEEAIEAFLKGDDYLNASRILLLRDPVSALNVLKGKEGEGFRVLRAILNFRAENYEEALKELEGVREDPIVLKIRGISEYHTKRFYEALRDLSKAMLSYPLDADIFYYRGLTKIALGDEQNAEKDLDVAINLNPYYAEAYLNKGILTENRGDINRAIELYSKSIDLRPNYKEAYIRRSKAYMKIGKESEARSDIESSERL